VDGSFSHDAVEEEFETIRRKEGVKSCITSWVKRSYAFGSKDIPTGESECMKVVYGFDRKLCTLALKALSHVVAQNRRFLLIKKAQVLLE
jgi:hypothetical protein